jgi:hypothetical protein
MLSPGETTHSDIDQGWLLPTPQQREPVHTRSILCRSFRRADGLLDIDARFIDTRPFAYDSEFRGPCQAGSTLHHMQLRVTLDSSRHVVALDSAMPGTPYRSCEAVNPNFQRVLGLSVGRGFRKALRERLGGVEGCTHVLALLDATAAAAMQAFASNAYAPSAAGAKRPARAWKIEALVDSCWSYKAGGEVLQQLRQHEDAGESFRTSA